MPSFKLSIFRKGLLLVGVPILFQLFLLGYLLKFQHDANEADQWALHTKDVMAKAEEAYRLLDESVSQVRGAIITGDATFNLARSETPEKVREATATLAEMVQDNPEQSRRVNRFRIGADAILARLQRERELVRGGKANDAARLVADKVVENSIADTHALLLEILSTERTLDARRTQRVAYLRRQGYWFVGGAAFATVVLATVAVWLFTRGIGMRLARLAENAQLLAERKELTRSVGGNDEIGTLARAFDEAAARLARADAVERQHRAEIEARAAELASANAELARANDDLRFKTQENETFVYSVSHDLRSPLVNLQGFSRELAYACEALRAAVLTPELPEDRRKQITDLLDGDILESVRFIQTAVLRSGNIIDALLRLSRAGRIELSSQRVDVRSTVLRVVEAMRSSLRDRHAEIVVNEMPDATGDPTAVDQIFGNLIGNAINYLDPSRPGRIEIGAAPPSDEGAAANSGEPAPSVRYYVRDNGMGIPAAYLPKMFVAFQRLHGAAAPGEGIGLAMIKRVIDRSGGTIAVESVEGVGTTFWVTLPAVAAAPEAPPAASGATELVSSATKDVE